MKQDYDIFSPLSKKILYISRYEYDYFFRKRNVVGVGFGYKESNGVSTCKPCIKVFVEKKCLGKNIVTEDFIPKFYKGILTDITESGPIELSILNDRVRPAPGGYSVSNIILKRCGTIGCLVTDGTEKYILSNNHILAGVNKSSPGTVIVQPGINDGGKYPKDEVGALSKFIPLLPSTSTEENINLVDCAIAKINNVSDISANIALVGKVRGVRVAKLKEDVKKTGRTTELTLGKVDAIGVSFNSTIFSQKYVFSDQIATTRMSKGGDSGSLLLGNDDKALGLLHGSTNSYSIFNDIGNVIGSLGVSIVTE